MPSIAHLRTLCSVGRLKEAIHILLTAINHPNKLINTYDKCERLKDACNVFENINEPNVSSWNTIIAAYRRHGFPQQALTLFHQILRLDGSFGIGFGDPFKDNRKWVFLRCCTCDCSDRHVIHKLGLLKKLWRFLKKTQVAGVEPDSYSFASIKPACAKVGYLEQGKEIHRKIIEDGFWSGVVVANALIDMYAKCESIEKALKLFEKMPQRDAISFNAIIAGCAHNGALDEALRFLEEIPHPNIVTWTTITAGCAQYGFVEKALVLFKKMQLFGMIPSSATFASILPACAKMGALEQGMEIHERIIEHGFFSDVEVVTALVDMYAKCGNIQKARELFDKMSQQNVVSWNAMLAGYVHNGVLDEALKAFQRNA
ncbi:pentatricopeptide repeat-containing protein At1g08070, chloroplastic [Cryptomeria japonica]|uniref:pentatricopeptide repeat-containing protein At1g08070, chloroplastic n=1 Tax=Cryptomeria japonica TaxID=3369 RepID=UPI0027D9FE08|nr:pentatricopeptide repeat-containing protein At1g08070, chloroplastic [Cryptomeria japonica]